MEEPKWVCTDPDSMQYQKRISKYVFEMREVREYPPETGIPPRLASDTIDLEDHSFPAVVSLMQHDYGYDLDSIMRLIEGDSWGVFAEAIFETENI